MKISVITINLNDKYGLKRTIQSVRSQDYNNIEHIVIDGASVDGSVDYLKENSEYFSFWSSESDSGIYQAFNKGIGRASGTFILFLNSGDFLLDSKVISSFVDSNLQEDIIYGNLWIDIYGKRKLITYPADLSLFFFYKRSLPHPASFIKKSIFEKYGNYNEELKIVSDWAYFFDLYLNTSVSFKKIELAVSVFCNDGVSGPNADTERHLSERQRVKTFLLPFLLRKTIDITLHYRLPLRRVIDGLARRNVTNSYLVNG